MEDSFQSRTDHSRRRYARSAHYQNAGARALIAAASDEHAKNADARASAPAAETGPWRERAQRGKRAQAGAWRNHRPAPPDRELLSRVRDLEHDLPEDGIARTITENHALRAQVRELTQEKRRLEERLAGARDTNRFLDKQVADLEAGSAGGGSGFTNAVVDRVRVLAMCWLFQ